MATGDRLLDPPSVSPDCQCMSPRRSPALLDVERRFDGCTVARTDAGRTGTWSGVDGHDVQCFHEVRHG
jgi:hypothetical protein